MFLSYNPSASCENINGTIWSSNRYENDVPCDGDVVLPPSWGHNRIIHQQSRRIAVAFGLETWSVGWDEGEACFRGVAEEATVVWKLDGRGGSLCSVSVGSGSKRCVVSLERDLEWGGPPWGSAWEFEPQQEFHHLMARGLYCLGFEDACITAQLPVLTLHEQIECMLAMPREFWPATWLES